MKRIIYLIVVSLILMSCTGRPTPLALPTESLPSTTPTQNMDQPVSVTPSDMTNPTPENVYAPKPGDEKLYRANVLIDEHNLLTLESYPLQFSVSISGSLPDPCHELRVSINPPNAENKITLDVYSVVDPNMICIQVVKAFKATVPLGSFPKGHYTVWLNGEMIGEFDA